jgi:hypothetical protein
VLAVYKCRFVRRYTALKGCPGLQYGCRLCDLCCAVLRRVRYSVPAETVEQAKLETSGPWVAYGIRAGWHPIAAVTADVGI